ncbi:hypothetical protein PSHT_16029 [Puccinia striiformis]|uniref:Uncharacterized protein n=1 Tax=Puccinia striiformis TaxID=27350 RepID=A0A2S4UCA9_9BASI|nr:hypothetical protein PSHT_16029 [Puccinia striiformis]
MNGEAFWDGIGQLNLPVRSSRANLEDAFAVGKNLLGRTMQGSTIQLFKCTGRPRLATGTAPWARPSLVRNVLFLPHHGLLVAPTDRSIYMVELDLGRRAWTYARNCRVHCGFFAYPGTSAGCKTRTPPIDCGKPFRQRTPDLEKQMDGISGGAALVTDQSSAWRRPSLDSYKSSKNKLVLSRQASFDSSIFKHVAGHYEMAHKATTEDLSWGKSERSQQEDLVETEWIAGNFDAIKGLRNG